MSKTNKQEIWFLIFVVFLAAAIRLIVLFNFGTYSYDEMFSIYFAQKPLDQLFTFLKNDIHPPLYYLLLHFWLILFGVAEIPARVFSLLFSLASIPLLYYLVKNLTNRWLAGLSTLFFVFSTFQIFTSVEARMYSLLTCLGLSSLNLFWQTIVKQKKLWLAYIAFSVLMLLTNLGGFFGLLTQWLWFVILGLKKQFTKPLTKKFLLSQIFILGVWLVWLGFFFLPQLPKRLDNDWFLKATINRQSTVGLYDFFFLFLDNYWLRFISGVIIFTAPFMILIWPEKGLNKQSPSYLNPNWLLFSWLLPAWLFASFSGFNISRFYLIAYLSLYPIVAYFFYLLFKHYKKIFYPLTSLWFIISLVNLFNFNLPISDWQQANNWLLVNERPNDKILIYCFVHELQFQKYYTGQNQFQGLYLKNDTQTLAERVIKENCLEAVTPKNIEGLLQLVGSAQRLIIIRETQPPDDYPSSLVNQWFQNNQWQLIQSYQNPAWTGPNIFIYQKL